MSVFNTRRDRFPNGKPKPHKFKWPDNYPAGASYVSKSPGWWNNLCTTKRRRMNDSEQRHHVLRGKDPDGLLWLPDKRPQVYYY